MALNPVAKLRQAFAKWRTQPPAGTVSPRSFSFGPKIGSVRLTHENAIRLAAVWACGSVIAKSIASSPWEVFVEDSKGNREMQRGSAAWRMLNVRPNPDMSAFTFKETMLLQAAFFGNAYAEIERDAVNRPVRLWPIEPGRSTLYRDDAGDLKLSVSGSGNPVELDYSDVYHLRGPGLDGFEGADIVQQAMYAMAQSAAAEKFGIAFYANGMSPGGVLTSETPIGSEEREDMRAALDKGHQGPEKAFKFLLLDGDLKFQPINTTPENAQFIETREFLVNEICRYFGVPPHKIQHLKQATFSNIEEQNIEFARDCLTPWCERMRQEADYKLLTSAVNLRSRIDTDWLSEGDAQSRATADSTLVLNGIMTRNEIRAKRGLNRVGSAADKLTVQGQNVPLEQAMKPPAPPAVPAPAAVPPGSDGGSPPAPAPKPSRQRAVQAFTQAWAKLLTDQGETVAFASRQEVDADFIADVEDKQTGHYLDCLGELHAITALLGADCGLSSWADHVRKTLEEDMRLIGAARATGKISSWCDIEERSHKLGEAAADIFEELSNG